MKTEKLMKNKKLKIRHSIFIISLVVILQTVAFAFAYKANVRDQQLKNYQINSLIEEVGELKVENDHLNKRLENQDNLLKLSTERSQITHNSASKTSASKTSAANLTEPQNSSEEITKLQQKLNSVESTYQKQLQEKQDALARLMQTKEQNQKNLELNEKVEVILLLGENAGLTDTIMLVVVNPLKSKVTLISVPRDLYFKGRKINEYYQKFGLEELKSSLKELTSLQIDGHFKVNFDAFRDFIDLVGGIEIDVDKKIVDDRYPGDNFSYQTVTFEKGIELMNGDRALQYIRTRKSTSDFDRMKRQQQVLSALKEKIKSLGITNNISSWTKAYQSISKNIDTNYNLLDILSFFENYKDFNIEKSSIFSNQSFLYSSKSAIGQYILLPLDPSFQKIKNSMVESI